MLSVPSFWGLSVYHWCYLVAGGIRRECKISTRSPVSLMQVWISGKMWLGRGLEKQLSHVDKNYRKIYQATNSRACRYCRFAYADRFMKYGILRASIQTRSITFQCWRFQYTRISWGSQVRLPGVRSQYYLWNIRDTGARSPATWRIFLSLLVLRCDKLLVAMWVKQ